MYNAMWVIDYCSRQWHSISNGNNSKSAQRTHHKDMSDESVECIVESQSYCQRE